MWSKINSIRAGKSGAPGDPPPRLLKEFALEIVCPVTEIFNNIVKTGNWPKVWKIEHGIPLKKKENVQSEDDIRVISLTPVLSKIMEQFVIEWLMIYIGDQIDLSQYGGKKGTSTAHYLI